MIYENSHIFTYKTKLVVKMTIMKNELMLRWDDLMKTLTVRQAEMSEFYSSSNIEPWEIATALQRLRGISDESPPNL